MGRKVKIYPVTENEFDFLTNDNPFDQFGWGSFGATLSMIGVALAKEDNILCLLGAILFGLAVALFLCGEKLRNSKRTIVAQIKAGCVDQVI